MLYTQSKFEESGDQMMNNNTYSVEENGNAKPFPEGIINDFNENKNMENHRVVRMNNN